MGHRLHGLAVFIGVRLGSSGDRTSGSPVTRMLTVGEPLELIRTHLPGESPLARELTVPLPADLVALGVVVVAGVAELLRVVRVDLRGAERFGDRDHGRAALR